MKANSFVESFDFLSTTQQRVVKLLQPIVNVSYEHIDKVAFEHDLFMIQDEIDSRMFFSWKYSSGTLCIIGIISADSLTDDEIQSIFTRLDDAVTNKMRKHTGHVNGENNGGTYGTMLLFSDSNKAMHFNDNIRNYYSSHFFKSTYVSALCIDCRSNTLTQGKAAFGMNWHGGIEINTLKKDLFEN